MNKEIIKVNALICPLCNDLIYSRARYDLRACSCGSISIEGGLDSVEIYYDKNKIKEKPKTFKFGVSATREEFLRDWSNEIDKLGLIEGKKNDL